ncbi:MAG: indolepyruvate ferredoxin oxidoreductase subunit alpha [Deltaproteobacteria bacterium]|nr:indolepyruvate ferredoxin oxidoreductase subunit alpha [Deltaproteobacteria bacterium]MBW1979161.1 indolepyruvate ferredoxin oxidoreductase subunit alpha [Deltaproteobacteria bacterium]MBW2046136.1 indolepyruvate ferredoxin oxidoreductase subunit alpha [Deltaproteobacteria bacterium]MBW2299070.1 indolepyruvate ferredoxin oxidoreductase subunit alpha [Deltaproteobacteria bacterium]RLB33357.1 MAG: indolepyruvate ferredoxin oxidoreductase subunit alpha [Deltaproteobacteria bacterium]
MHKLLTDSPGTEMLLLGNEAIARGALEAGLAFATCYPGTPSSEIPEQFFAISKETDLYFEYSTNEKVAMEVAAGAAISGLRTMVTMKHVGLNVAADPLMTLAYTGVEAGMVIVNADDPYLFSSQNEQDNRYYARLSSLPMLEPTNTQEMKDWTKAAFELSEELKLPVILRTTTRLAHVRGGVKLGELQPRKVKTTFKKDPFHYVCVPAVSRELHKLLLRKYDQAVEKSENSPMNEIIGNGPWGIVANGVSVNYVMDAVSDLGIEDKVSILKLGFSYPMPRDLCVRFMEPLEKVLVVEELEPVVEHELKTIAQETGLTLEIKGKGVGELSRLFEYNPGMVRKGIAEYFEIDYKAPLPVDTSDFPALPGRPPNLCAGCPHRATFYAVKQVYGTDAIHPTDIGCYTLGLLPPLSMGDLVICMGSSVSSSCGFSRATDQKVASFIGDSTFFHSGITGLVNAVHNNHKFTLVIMDNGTTAMTGHQPHPGVEPETTGLDLPKVSVEDVVRGCGVKDVHVVRPYNLKKTIEAVRASMEYDGLSVIVSKEYCPLFARRIGKARKARPFYVNLDKCKNHRDCINLLACPAMFLEGEQVHIDKNLCIGCTVCAQVCPENAIMPLKG